MLTIDCKHFGCFGELKKRRRTELIVVHHTCTAKPERTRKVLQSKGYSTHFEIDRDGKIYQYADLDRKCIHCGSLNCASISIDLTHPKDADFPTAQIESLYELLAFICHKYGFPLEIHERLDPGVYWHRAIGDTVCPQGVPIRADLAQRFAAMYGGDDAPLPVYLEAKKKGLAI